MGKKKRSSSTGSLKSFILLLLILGGGAYFYQNQQNLPEAKELTKELSHTLEKAQKEVAQRLPEKPQDEAESQPSANRISSKLEIPVMLTKREEIKLQRTGYTVSYNNFYKTPNWVAWELTRQETKGSEERKEPLRTRPGFARTPRGACGLYALRIRPGTHGSGGRHEMEQESHGRIILHEQHLSAESETEPGRLGRFGRIMPQLGPEIWHGTHCLRTYL